MLIVCLKFFFDFYIDRIFSSKFPNRKSFLLSNQIAQCRRRIETDHGGDLFHRIVGAAQVVLGVFHTENTQCAAERGSEQGLKYPVYMSWCNIQIFCDAVDGNIILVVHMDKFGCFQSQIQSPVWTFLSRVRVVDMSE